jgi:hypothetical protein
MEESRVCVCFNASCHVSDIAETTISGRFNNDYIALSAPSSGNPRGVVLRINTQSRDIKCPCADFHWEQLFLLLLQQNPNFKFQRIQKNPVFRQEAQNAHNRKVKSENWKVCRLITIFNNVEKNCCFVWDSGPRESPLHLRWAISQEQHTPLLESANCTRWSRCGLHSTLVCCTYLWKRGRSITQWLPNSLGCPGNVLACFQNLCVFKLDIQHSNSVRVGSVVTKPQPGIINGTREAYVR